MTQEDRLFHAVAHLGAALSHPAIANEPAIMAHIDDAHQLVTKALEQARVAEREKEKAA